MKYQVHIEDSGETYNCDAASSLLVGMESLGRKGIPVGCRNGGCGICKVQVLEGEYKKRVMSRAHISDAEEAGGQALACRVMPSSDLRIKVLGLMKQRVCGAPENKTQ